MPTLDILNDSGIKISQISLNDAIFNVPVNINLLHQVVVAQLSAKRAGTASVKGRSDVVGSRRKLYRQKGTGRARKGDIKSPLLRGGGVIFGPGNRSFKKKIMKKVARVSLKMALTIKLKNNQIIVIDKFKLDSPKTKNFVKIIDNLNVKNSLIITDRYNNFLDLSSRNVLGIKVLNYIGLNVRDILGYHNLILLKSTVKKIESKLL